MEVTFPVKLHKLNGPTILVLLLAFLVWRMPVDMAHNATALLGHLGTAADKLVLFAKTLGA
jgi:hypothetical protein